MDKLVSAELDDLPVVVKFLLQTVEPENVGEVIETIRQKLDFRSINKLQKTSRSKPKKVTVNQTPEVLILGIHWDLSLQCFRSSSRIYLKSNYSPTVCGPLQ